MSRERFSTRETRELLREGIRSQRLGRFHEDASDDPLPHILWGLLNDIDALELEAGDLSRSLGKWTRACPEDLRKVLEEIDSLVPDSDDAYPVEMRDARRDVYVRLMYAASDACASLLRENEELRANLTLPTPEYLETALGPSASPEEMEARRRGAREFIEEARRPKGGG